MKFGQQHFQSLGRKPKGLGLDRLNKTEAEYAGMLDARQRAGEVVWYRFEAIKIRLADNTFYTPDFLVLLADMSLEIHEVKGAFVMDDAKVRRWPHIKLMLEAAEPGVMTEVMARLARLRMDQKEEKANERMETNRNRAIRRAS